LRFTDKVLSARAAVFFCYAPRVLGGLQAPIGLTLDCNFSGSGSIEAMAYIKTYTRHNTELTSWFLKLARTDVRSASGRTLIRNYKTVSAATAGISSDYLGPSIRLALVDFVTSSFGERLMLYSRVTDDKDLGEAILKSTAAISATVLNMVDKSLISSIFTGFVRKFDSSSTMQKLLGSKKLHDIEAKIHVDEKIYIRSFRERVMKH